MRACWLLLLWCVRDAAPQEEEQDASWDDTFEDNPDEFEIFEPEKPPPAIPVTPPSSVPDIGRVLLEEATFLLKVGRFEDAIALSIPAISQHPELAPSFQAVAALATDQLNRTDSISAMTPQNMPSQTGSRSKEVRFGVDLGLPTGVRVDWKRSRGVADSVGFQIGGTLMYLSEPSVQLNYYVDWRMGEKFQLVTPVGLLISYGSPYLIVGLAGQFDPPDKPFHVDVGVNVGTSSVFVPTASVGFLW
ncbi:MAG: hypothetical protein AAFV53_16930 [Myxococcota bacterium]